MRRAAIAVAALAAIALGGAGTAQAAERPAPDYTAAALGSGEEVSVAGLRGEVVLLNVWATWCLPCREEMPAFQAVHERYGGQGLRLVGVSIDQGPADAQVADYVEAAGITFEIWRDPTSRITHAFRVLGPPETFLITKDGQIAHHWRGQVDVNAPENITLIRQAMGLEAAGPGSAPVAAAGAVGTVAMLVAFGAGLLSVLSPCVLPLVPSYASVIAGVSVRRARSLTPAMVGAPGEQGAHPVVGQVSRTVALRAGLAFVAGFSAVFMTLGVLVNRAGALLADQRVWLTRGGGVVLVLLGLHLLGVLRVPGADREARFSKLGRAKPVTRGCSWSGWRSRQAGAPASALCSPASSRWRRRAGPRGSRRRFSAPTPPASRSRSWPPRSRSTASSAGPRGCAAPGSPSPSGSAAC